jgi:hypothetical protein
VIPLAWKKWSTETVSMERVSFPPTDADHHVIRDVRLDGYKVATHDRNIMVINGKDKCRIHGRVDQPQEVSLASFERGVVLESMPSSTSIAAQSVQEDTGHPGGSSPVKFHLEVLKPTPVVPLESRSQFPESCFSRKTLDAT